MMERKLAIEILLEMMIVTLGGMSESMIMVGTMVFV